MDPFIITAVDCNVKHEVMAMNGDGGRHPDHETTAMTFPTNVKYVFEDDEDLSVDHEDEEIGNVVVVETNANLEVTHVELISDRFKQLSWETAQDDNQELHMRVISRFEPLLEADDLPLEKLMEIYQKRNEQLNNLFNTLSTT
ncbi:LAME_0F04962g1_1 [Lachancea meyersii CBS 8951]|uniref:LAME_0F04962g1_1 n=1 Tax=Lachancea meyersii CBS 8951 TaxID=1266667 RepID=A0A1G4JST3_9SACH|nr:LAME_0F04962g1_1 [Lachancea meyersii CBS 8951]